MTYVLVYFNGLMTGEISVSQEFPGFKGLYVVKPIIQPDLLLLFRFRVLQNRLFFSRISDKIMSQSSLDILASALSFLHGM